MINTMHAVIKQYTQVQCKTSGNSEWAAPYLHTISDAKSPGNKSVFTPASSHTFFVCCKQQEEQIWALH